MRNLLLFNMFSIFLWSISCGKAATDELTKSESKDEFAIGGSEWSLKVSEQKTKGDLAATLVIKEYSLLLQEKGRFHIEESESKKLVVVGSYKYIQVKPSILFNIENSELDLFGKTGDTKIFRLEKDGSDTKLINQDTYLSKVEHKTAQDTPSKSEDSERIKDISRQKVVGLWKCESKDLNASIQLQQDTFNLKLTTNKLVNTLVSGEYTLDNGLLTFDVKESQVDSLHTSSLELHFSKVNKAKFVFTETADAKSKIAACEKINQSGG